MWTINLCRHKFVFFEQVLDVEKGDNRLVGGGDDDDWRSTATFFGRRRSWSHHWDRVFLLRRTEQINFNSIN